MAAAGHGPGRCPGVLEMRWSSTAEAHQRRSVRRWPEGGIGVVFGRPFRAPRSRRSASPRLTALGEAPLVLHLSTRERIVGRVQVVVDGDLDLVGLAVVFRGDRDCLGSWEGLGQARLAAFVYFAGIPGQAE